MSLDRTALRARLRRAKRFVDNPEVAKLRMIMRTFTDGQVPAVMHFGESESLFVGDDDADQRTLPQMLQENLGSGLPILTYAGGGYMPALYDAILRHLSRFDSRPVLLIAIATRLGQPPWALHPLYSYPRATAWVEAASLRRPVWAYRALLPTTATHQMASLDATLFPTLEGTRSIGEYRRTLRDPSAYGLSATEAKRRLFAYHHGSIRPPRGDWLDSVQRLGATARSLGYRALVYEPSIPIERGAEFFGAELTELNRRFTEQVRRAFAAGYGEGASVPTALALGSDSFIDIDDATEHLNDRGRLALVDLIAAAVRRELSAVCG